MTASSIAERIYYDSAELEFSATVTVIREVARVDGRQVWQIALDRTAFYPTSGGQPHDTGELRATARSGAVLSVPITGVEEDEAGEVWHTTAKPLQEGTLVTGVVDAVRRRDHMQQHSGQHLLSAVLLRNCGAKTVSFHLGEETSTIDLDVPSLTEEQLLLAEKAVNEVVASALPLTVRYVSGEEAETMLAEGLLRKLPPRAGRIRLVVMPDVDLNACGGTHVATTAAIGPVLLRGTERVRGGVRLEFVCGGRALQAAHDEHALLTSLGRLLSTAPSEIAAGVGRMQAELKTSGKERAALLASIAELEAKSARHSGAELAVMQVDASLPGRDAAYAKLLASRTVAMSAAPAVLVALREGDRVFAVLAAKPGSLDCGAALRDALSSLDGRGGGSRELAQGTVALERLDELQQAVRAAFRSAASPAPAS